jgi:hypothetical protein
VIKIVYIFDKKATTVYMVTLELLSAKGTFKIISDIILVDGLPNISKKRHMKKVTWHDEMYNGDALETPNMRCNVNVRQTAFVKDVLKTQSLLNKGRFSEEEAKEIFQKNIRNVYWLNYVYLYSASSMHYIVKDKAFENRCLLQMLRKVVERRALVNVNYKLVPLIDKLCDLFVQLSCGGNFRYLVPFILAYYSHLKCEHKKNCRGIPIPTSNFSGLLIWVSEDAPLLKQWESFFEHHYYETSHFDHVRYIYFGHALRLLGVRQVNYADEGAFTRAKYLSYYNRQWCYQNRFKENGSIIVGYGDFNELRKIKDYLAIGGARRKFNGARVKTFEEQSFLGENFALYVQLARRGDFMF